MQLHSETQPAVLCCVPFRSCLLPQGHVNTKYVIMGQHVCPVTQAPPHVTKYVYTFRQLWGILSWNMDVKGRPCNSMQRWPLRIGAKTESKLPYLRQLQRLHLAVWGRQPLNWILPDICFLVTYFLLPFCTSHLSVFFEFSISSFPAAKMYNRFFFFTYFFCEVLFIKARDSKRVIGCEHALVCSHAYFLKQGCGTYCMFQS